MVRALTALVLDTCALLDLTAGRLHHPSARRALVDAVSARELYVPSVVALEIAQKVWTGRLQLGARPAEWFGAALDRLTARELPLAASSAAAAYELPEPFHRDPADRILVAEARIMDAPLLTSDRRILAYARAGHVQAVAY
ncbi:MAG TPA: type II toxin-antitoxin system VapC family toxin [Geminicoccaceae bacterium]|nr:type II toxin-antitoxin system VapC family toxin [Geminicoccaceae bacterium]